MPSKEQMLRSFLERPEEWVMRRQARLRMSLRTEFRLRKLAPRFRVRTVYITEQLSQYFYVRARNAPANDAVMYLARHAAGDWGEVPEIAEASEQQFLLKQPVVSVFAMKEWYAWMRNPDPERRVMVCTKPEERRTYLAFTVHNPETGDWDWLETEANRRWEPLLI